MTINGNKTIADLLSIAVLALTQAGIETAHLDSELLLCHVLSCTRIDLVLNRTKQLSHKDQLRFLELVERRKSHEPISYITGEKEFMSLPFSVCEGILIPRPETELLAEMIIEQYQTKDGIRILDLCTGSGAIAVSLAYYLQNASVTAIDKFAVCIDTARKNAARHNVLERMTFLKQDILETFDISNTFECIVSNPPYVTKYALKSLPPDVKNFEPEYALDGGDDGLIFYRRIADYAKEALVDGGRIYFEIGYDQGLAVQEILQKTEMFSNIKITKDYAGLDRIVSALKGDL